MVRYRVRTLFIVIALLALIVAVGKRIYNWQQQLAAEYVTAGIIRDVTQFVESHNGQWPRSWDDIPGNNHARQHVRMRFDVSINELISNPELIHSVIVPASGVYYTYPHAEQDLNQLRDALARFHNK